MEIRRVASTLSQLGRVHGPPTSSFHKNESIFQAVFNATFQFIALLTPKGMLLKANQTALDIIQPLNEELIGQNFWESPWWRNSPSTQRRVKAAITRASKNHFVRFEIDQISPKGDILNFDFSFKPVVNAQGNVILIIAEGRDITLRKKLDLLRNEFLSAVTHELKTPITVLKLLIQSHLNKAKKTGTETISSAQLELIDKELSRLTTLINDLLDSSRFEIGKLSLETGSLNLTKLVEEVVHEMRFYAQDHIITITPSSQIIEVIGDQKRIKQVIINLLSNAVKYSEPGTTITLNVIRKNANAIVSVKDQGKGIPKSKHKIIFDKYYQVKTKTPNGFGLGLYISKEIIKSHKGKIWVVSPRNKGSTFYFSLPLHKCG